MAAFFRLTNLTHSDLAHSLPLPSLSPLGGKGDFRGNSLPELNGRGAAQDGEQDSSHLLAHARDVADLLQHTDISFLSLHDKEQGSSRPLEQSGGTLRAAIQRLYPAAFDWHPSVTEVASQPLGATAYLATEDEQFKGSHVPASQPTTGQDAVGVRKDKDADGLPKPKIRRRRSALAQRASKGDDGVGGLCQLLDATFDMVNGGSEDATVCETLSFQELRGLHDEILKPQVRANLPGLPLDYLSKLMNLLDTHVKLGQGQILENEDEVDSAAFSAVLVALEAIQISLVIMTTPGMPKHVFHEELIDRMVEVTRFHIVQNIFTFFDPAYRQIYRNEKAGKQDYEDDENDEDEGDATGSAKAKRKSKAAVSKKPAADRVSKAVKDLLQRICSVVAGLGDLMVAARMQDSTVLQLSRTVLATFLVENISLLQIKALDAICMVFALYEQHRTIILDEVVSMLWKLPIAKRNLRTYHLPDSDKRIQHFTALILYLTQSCVDLPPPTSQPSSQGQQQALGPQGEHTPVHRSIEPAIEVATYIWKQVLERWATPKAQDGLDTKSLVENVVVDLLESLHVPEFPAASLLLQVFCAYTLSSGGLKSKDTTVKSMAIDLLGLVASRLKADCVASEAEKLWILQELDTPTGSDAGAFCSEAKASLPKSGKKLGTCPLCGQICSSGAAVSCASCRKHYHSSCLGLLESSVMARTWYCAVCFCRRQLGALESEIQQPEEGKPGGGVLLAASKSSASDRELAERQNSAGGLAVVQQILLNHMQGAASNHDTASYARRFHICQWFRDDSLGAERLEFYRKRLEAASSSEPRTWSFALSRDDVWKISRGLGQLRPLARALDKIIDALLVSLDEKSPAPRSKALKAVSSIVEVDPGVLRDPRVQQAVEGRFLDAAISVREAAIDLIGKHIMLFPDVALKYYAKITERIMDTGVSVRKKVIKIIKDVCLSATGSEQSIDGCVKIISRINDEEASIRDLVTKTLHELWFEEPTSRNGTGAHSDVKETTQQLVEVLRRLPSSQPLVAIIKRSLAQDLNNHAEKGQEAAAVNPGAIWKRCEQMCKCLIESILQAEELAGENSEARALPYVMALHSFCTIDPTLCAPPADPSRFAMTLEPYLKAQGVKQEAGLLLQSIIYVIDAVLPLMRRPSPTFVEDLEKDLGTLIFKNQFMHVVHAAVKCLCALRQLAPKVQATYNKLVAHFFRILEAPYEASEALQRRGSIYRSLLALGQFVRYGLEGIADMGRPDITVDAITSLYKRHLRSPDFELKKRALQGFGFIFIARPSLMLDQDCSALIRATLSARGHPKLKAQTLKNFHDYLHDVEEKLGDADVKSQEGDPPAGAVPVAAGAGDNSNWTGIAQLYWDPIFARALDPDVDVRTAALKVMEVVLRQGLVHPVTCVPTLIALEVDPNEQNSKLAHQLLKNMNEKHSDLLETRLGDGLQLSFEFAQLGGTAGAAGAPREEGAASVALHWSPDSVTESSKEGVSRIYKLIRTSRQSRNKFLSSVVRKFDFTGQVITSHTLPFLVYCAEILASLPFGVPDEPLYLIYSINRTVALRGGQVHASMKSMISGGGPLAEHAQAALDEIAREKEEKGEEAYDIFGTDDTAPQGQSWAPGDDTQGASEDVVQRLQDDCTFAMALSLLILLKRWLKGTYSLNDARCQAFQPSEVIKAGDIISRREVVPFSSKELPLRPPDTMRQMLEQYQAFKILLKEDSVRDFTQFAAVPRRRGAGGHAAGGANVGSAPHEGGGEGSGPAAAVKGRERRASAVLASYQESPEDEGVDHEEDADSDGGDDVPKSRKRRRTIGGRGSRRGGQGRSTKYSL